MARTGENIYKRKDGRYEGRYIQKYDADGKPKWGYEPSPKKWTENEIKKRNES